MKHIFTFFTISLLSISKLDAQQYNPVTSLNCFSIDIYKQIKTDKENLFFSPISINQALLSVYEGTREETKNEFEKVLYLSEVQDSRDKVDFATNLMKLKDSSNYIILSNAIWINNKFKIQKKFLSDIANYYATDAYPIDFSNKEKSSLMINNWVSKKTNNVIKDIINPNEIDDLTKIIISNTIYFIGKWDNEFDNRNTKQDEFFSIARKEIRLDFMNIHEYIQYYENKDFKFISKDYQGCEISFCVILPNNRYGISDVENLLSNSTLDSIYKNMKKVEVLLSLPKFSLETTNNLIEPLKELGLRKAFTQEADFSGVTIDEPLFINNVKHKAFIEINEEKTVAGASTIIGILAGSSGRHRPKPKEFKADHPFIFLILDNKTKGILFMGRYVNPQ